MAGTEAVLVTGLLAEYTSESVFAVLLGALVLLRFRRYKAVGGAAVGAVSSVATVVAGVFATLVLLVVLGYWDPPVSEIVGDALGAGRAFYDLVGEWVLRQTVERLDDIAAA
ncbi:hypothetical protein [Halorubrum tebenquichense]|uniref:Uncharacterized protein n=1 Tax=Halorubrum tebenquichense DSM 14210 TaxID=1227485 RepID=M0E673_9EURY|nr:hypothetical protein [Halorubrum tebenquichense]ELZ41854.1 hypothetical protein C472_00384 [Halorubrum tebenquichense DSM 14210]